MKDAAFKSHVDGFSIIPLRKNKKPFLTSWKKYQEVLPTEDEILEWWTRYPDALIGIVTGKISGITVVDVDTYHGGDHTIFPETYTVRTGNGGYHFYYKYQPGYTVSAGAYPGLPGVDVRSDTGYVVAPPSKTEYKDKDGNTLGGEYTVIKDIPFAPFPDHIFSGKKKRKKLTDKIGLTTGSRNDTITSFIGSVLTASNPSKWETECWPATLSVNKTYTPPLSEKEVRAAFDSIAKKERTRREEMENGTLSPIQLSNGEIMYTLIRKNSNGVPYKDMANVMVILNAHPKYKGNIRYNEFKQEIEINKKSFEEDDLVNMQYVMQTEGKLPNVSKDAVYAAITFYASQNRYDEAKEWLTSLVWDGTPRLATWIPRSTGVEDNPYHQGIGSQWLTGIVRRIMEPGCTFDYALTMVGDQNLGKTSFFRIIGGPWYKSYTGAVDNKDFYLALRGAMVVDLDEGSTLYKSEAIKIKSIITETHDEFRAPYDRVTKRYPRRFVFSMSTNDTKPFRDVTGNRRYWTIDIIERVDFAWLEESREQLFAEAYHCYKNKVAIPEVPFSDAQDQQDLHLAVDAWTDAIVDYIEKLPGYLRGDPDFSTTIIDVYKGAVTTRIEDSSIERLDKRAEMRIANVLTRALGMESIRRMIDGERKFRWFITEKRLKELQNKKKDNHEEF